MTKAIREKVFQKYGGRCAYCGKEIAYKDMQVDHLIPKADEIYRHESRETIKDTKNLMPSCRTCNHYKRAYDLEYFRELIEQIPAKLGKREYIYKVGMAYGFYDDKPRKIEFYFETSPFNE